MFLIFVLLIYLNVIRPQFGVSGKATAENNLRIISAPPLDSGTLPDTDLHLYCEDGRHVGVNYETGEYEVGVEGAIVSGDNQNAPEWIFVPEGVIGCHYVVSSYDNQKFLQENPEIAQQIADPADSYEVYARYIDPASDIYTSSTITETIEPGAEIEHKISGTANIAIEPGVSVENTFEDSDGRGTKIIINTAEKTFHFTAPDRDLGVIRADKMDIKIEEGKEVIVIGYSDGIINFRATAMRSEDFCSASVMDKDWKEHYLLIDKPGMEN